MGYIESVVCSELPSVCRTFADVGVNGERQTTRVVLTPPGTVHDVVGDMCISVDVKGVTDVIRHRNVKYTCKGVRRLPMCNAREKYPCQKHRHDKSRQYFVEKTHYSRRV